MGQKVIVIGGVAGGASAAARLRRVDEQAEIIIIERGIAISYANCGLPYYIGGVISERENLFVQTPEGMKRRFKIDVRVQHEVVKIDRGASEVEVKNLINGQVYRETYDKLVLAPGSYPIVPNLPGINLSRVFKLRDIPDTDAIKKFVDENQISEAVVVGGGFIGVEMAENLVHRGLKVTLVEFAPQVLNNLDYEMAAIVQQELRNKGVKLLLNCGVIGIAEAQSGLAVDLNNETQLNTDLVIMAVGVRPETSLAAAAGLELGVTKAIKVNQRLQTSDPNIFALGDAVEVKEIITGKEIWLPLAGPANRQGRLLGDILAGRLGEYQGVQLTAIAKVFDLTAGSTGLSEKTLQKAGVAYLSSITHSSSHATYYPGAMPLTIKLIYTPEGKLLGAQVVGYEGADKRLDLLATALRFGKSVHDLTELELAYAPPFSSAKDPVNIAGYVAMNLVNGDMTAIAWDQIDKVNLEESLLLDVREPAEVALGTIPGAINIPLPELRERLTELDLKREIIIYCQVGLRGYVAGRILLQKGFRKVKNLSGGFKTYQMVQREKNVNQSDNLTKSEVSVVKEPNLSDFKKKIVKLDASGLQCPGPIIKVAKKMLDLAEGEQLEVIASDPGFANDIGAWTERTGNLLLKVERTSEGVVAVLQKGTQAQQQVVATTGQDKTIVVFSGELDKAIASFIIATGAAAMGRKVTMFFTFWGLNVLRKPTKSNVTKDFLSQIFGMMMPRGSTKLGLSRMNMGGLGAKMIRMVMQQKNISSLEELIQEAKNSGIRIVACQMSMDVMGIASEELVEGVEIGGVASYLAAAETGNVNLFI